MSKTNETYPCKRHGFHETSRIIIVKNKIIRFSFILLINFMWFILIMKKTACYNIKPFNLICNQFYKKWELHFHFRNSFDGSLLLNVFPWFSVFCDFFYFCVLCEMVFESLNCSFDIAPSGFSNVFLLEISTY